MSAYGPSARYPVQPVNEEAPTFPTGLYGATKVMGESLARHYFRQFGLDVIGLRANLVYGPGRVRGLGEFKIWSRDLFEDAVQCWHRTRSVWRPVTRLAVCDRFRRGD